MTRGCCGESVEHGDCMADRNARGGNVYISDPQALREGRDTVLLAYALRWRRMNCMHLWRDGADLLASRKGWLHYLSGGTSYMDLGWKGQE